MTSSSYGDGILARLTDALGDRYRIEREIGSGGMAIVFLAEDLKHGRRVALKVLRPRPGHELGADRFLREIRIAAGLSHPNILPLFDSGEADGLLYYVMPYVEGATLRDRLNREGKLPVAEVIRIVREVGGALGRAHEAGVVHRDIKPENILFESGHARVADFGVARAVSAAGGETLTDTGVALGTPAYMSPEQATGEATVDARSDIYSLGCLAWEMLAGTPPFTGSSARAILAGHLAGSVPSLRERRPNVPAGVERAIGRALAKEPGQRFSTTDEMVGALTEAITAEAAVAERRRTVRRRWLRAAASIAALAAVALGGWWLKDALTGPAIERLAVLPASNMTRDPEQDYFVDGVHEALVSELQRTGIPISARQSVLRYRASDKPIRQIAEELGVDALIQPGVAVDADSVVVDVSLYDGRTEELLWAESFGATMQGVLGLYRDVSRRIAREVGTVLSTGAEARLRERPIVDPRVLEAVLRGDFHLRRFNPQDFAIALQFYESALAIDSTYAPAQVGVASVWGYRAQAGLVPPAEALPALKAHLNRALALDPDLARARFLEAAWLFLVEWEFDRGEAGYRRALELDPNDAEVQVFYGQILVILGRWDEALEHGRLAMELDPLNPFVPGLYATLLASTGRLDDAIALLEETRQRNPGADFGITPLYMVLHTVGRHDEELDLRKQFFASRRDTEMVDVLDRGLAAGGYPAALKAGADRLAERARATYVNPMIDRGDVRGRR